MLYRLARQFIDDYEPDMGMIPSRYEVHMAIFLCASSVGLSFSCLTQSIKHSVLGHLSGKDCSGENGLEELQVCCLIIFL